MTSRDEQRAATRAAIVAAAAEILTASGAAGTTTLAVQRAAGISRGALLHHFPAREELLAAAIGSLRTGNREAVRRALEDSVAADPVDRAVGALAASVVRPEFSAELGLWAAARADAALRNALQREERVAKDALYEVVDDAFGAEIVEHPSYPRVVALTVQFLRGLALTQTLRDDDGPTEALVHDWSDVVRLILSTGAPLPQPSPRSST